MAHTHEEINRHIKTYLMVFGALLVLTAATVGAWKLHFLAAGPAIALALMIASVKASLVALFGKKLYDKDPEWFTNRVENSGLFWHFVDLVWIFLFPILYLL